jgi:hypothetical protein
MYLSPFGQHERCIAATLAGESNSQYFEQGSSVVRLCSVQWTSGFG